MGGCIKQMCDWTCEEKQHSCDIILLWISAFSWKYNTENHNQHLAGSSCVMFKCDLMTITAAGIFKA